MTKEVIAEFLYILSNYTLDLYSNGKYLHFLTPFMCSYKRCALLAIVKTSSSDFTR